MILRWAITKISFDWQVDANNTWLKAQLTVDAITNVQEVELAAPILLSVGWFCPLQFETRDTSGSCIKTLFRLSDMPCLIGDCWCLLVIFALSPKMHATIITITMKIIRRFWQCHGTAEAEGKSARYTHVQKVNGTYTIVCYITVWHYCSYCSLVLLLLLVAVHVFTNMHMIT